MPYSSDELATEDWADDNAPPKRHRPGGSGIGGVRAAREERERARKRPEVVDGEVIPDPQEPAAEPEPEAEAPAAEQGPPDTVAAVRKSARDQLNGAIFAIFGELDMNGDDRREDRLVVIRALVEKSEIQSSKELDDDSLQKLRNELVDRRRAGTLERDVTDALNAESLRQENAAQQQGES